MNFMLLSPWTSMPPVARGALSPGPRSLLPFPLHLYKNYFCKRLAKSGGEERFLYGNLAALKAQGQPAAGPGCARGALLLLCPSGDPVSALCSRAPAFAFYSIELFETGLGF